MYLLFLATIFISAATFLRQGVKNGPKYFLITTIIVLFLYGALRSQNMHIDIPVYVDYYVDYSKFSFNEIISLYSTNLKDPTYYVTGWLFSRIFPDPQYWLAVVAGVFLLAIYMLLKEESKAPLLSVIALLALGYFEFTLSGLRQSIAISLVVLSYFFIKKRKFFKFIFIVAIASLFHRTAMIFLIAYPLSKLRMGISHLIALIISVVLFLGFQSTIRNLMEIFFTDTSLDGYIGREVSLTISGFIIQLAIFSFDLVYYKRVIQKFTHANILYNIVFIGLIFQLFSSMIAEIFRVSMYFSIFNIVLIPMAVMSEGNKKVQSVEIVSIMLVLLAYLFISGIPNYSFFW